MRTFYLFTLFTLFSYILSAQDKLKVGIVLYKSEEKVRSAYTPLMQYVAEQMGMEADVNIVGEDDLAYYLDNGEYDLGVFTVFPYLKEKADFPDLKVFATHQVKGKDHFYGTILVNKGSDIEDFEDLKGKKFMFVKPTSTSGFKYPKGVLTEHSIDIETMLDYDFAGGHEEAIMALKKGEVDAIAVDETRFKKIDGVEKSDFKELERYKVPYHAYVFSPKMKVETQNKIKTIFENAHKDPSQRQLWNNSMGIEKWLLKKDEYYNLIRRYLRIIRVKPEVDINISATEKAQKKLDELGDVATVIENRIRRHFAESKRFSNKHSHAAEYQMDIRLAATGDRYSYQVQINDEFVTDGEVNADSINRVVPLVASRALLKKGEIRTNLLYNGSQWFITYGLNDGINLEDYEFELTKKDGRKELIAPKNIEMVDELNIIFEDKSEFYKGAPLVIRFAEEIKQFEEDIAEISTYNIFSKDFWNQNYWDKLGLIGGVVIALVSAAFGKVLADRKKKRFKNILYQTNDLIKEFMEGHYKMEAKLIEQKENISHALEEGHINENQFLILNQRIDDMQNLIEIRQKGDVQVSDDEANEIADIVKDGTVTERDFSRIMSILRKSKPTSA